MTSESTSTKYSFHEVPLLKRSSLISHKVMDIALRSVSPEHLYLSKNSPGNTGDEFVTHVIGKEGIGRE
jgi:hypothetical protein